MELLKPESIWHYKNSIYRIIRLEMEGMSQDALGDWVPTVVYELAAGRQQLHFYRPYTDFLLKFCTFETRR